MRNDQPLSSFDCVFRRAAAASGFVRVDGLGRQWTSGGGAGGMWERKAR
ncbi:MAG: hypothetical protein PHW76_04580 [Alphaproteobacteria bacterium]|nr:hypothetical protein [Alphaproteobacteria bacterium]